MRRRIQEEDDNIHYQRPGNISLLATWISLRSSRLISNVVNGCIQEKQPPAFTCW